VEGIKSGEDFIYFLGMIEKEVLEDDEVDNRLQLEFTHVIARKLNFTAKLPDRESLTIAMPDQPDWNCLARLFLVGSFEN
jgi:hypothetical protein